MTATALKPYQEKALDTCDGVIEIAKNEMLTRGVYVTVVVRPKMRDAGSICGGRKACLVGSMFLSHGGFEDIDNVIMASSGRRSTMRRKPGLRLAYNAINEAAYRRLLKLNPKVLKREEQDYLEAGYEDGPNEGWGEWFFETYLHYRTSYTETRKEVIQVCRNAKRLIKTGVVS